MTTFEQALDRAFETAWKHSMKVHEIRDETGSSPEDHLEQLRLACAEEAFVGAVDVLGQLLLLDGRIAAFEASVDSGGHTQRWIEGSSATAALLMDWAHVSGHVSDVDYAAWKSLQALGSRALQR